MAIDRGDGPNPLARGSDGPMPLWEVVVRRFGSDGPIPLALVPIAQGNEVSVKWSGRHQLGVSERAKLETIPPDDLPGWAGKKKHRLGQAGWQPSGAFCFDVLAGSMPFFRVRWNFSLIEHRCLITSEADCTLQTPVKPNLAVLDRNSKVGEWDWRPQLQRDALCMVVGQTAFDAGYTPDREVYTEVWELDNGQYYYFGFNDHGVDQPPGPLMGHFIVEFVAVGDSPTVSLGPVAGPAVRLG